MKAYVLVPGYVYSRYDNDRHYINARKLSRLYRVPMERCEVCLDISHLPRYKNLIQLHPREDGAYATSKSSHLIESAIAQATCELEMFRRYHR